MNKIRFRHLYIKDLLLDFIILTYYLHIFDGIEKSGFRSLSFAMQGSDMSKHWSDWSQIG